MNPVTDWEKNAQALSDSIDRMQAEIERLTEEVALWKDRWEAERQAHKATIKDCDENHTEREP